MYPYTLERYTRFVELSAQYLENPLSNDYILSVFSSSSSIVLKPEKRDAYMQNFDKKDFFGDDYTTAQIDDMSDMFRIPIPVIIVYAMFNTIVESAPLHKSRKGKEFFKRIHEAGKADSLVDAIKCYAVRTASKMHGMAFTEDEQFPVSEMMIKWMVPIIREYNLAYKKFIIPGNRTDLRKSGGMKAAIERNEEVLNSTHCKTLTQYTPTVNLYPCQVVLKLYYLRNQYLLNYYPFPLYATLYLKGFAYREPVDDKTSVSFREQTYIFLGITIWYPSKDEISNLEVSRWYNKIKSECLGPNGNLVRGYPNYIWAAQPYTGTYSIVLSNENSYL